MNARSFIIQGLILFIALVFSIRLFSIQVIDDDYKLAAQNNILQKIIDYPFRGLIYDRDGNLLVYNTPVYDLMVVPKEVDLTDSSALMDLLNIDHETFQAKYDKARRYSNILSSKFVEQIPNEEFARIQDQLVKYSGFYPLPRTVRGYEKSILANTLGYIAEVSRSEINRDSTNYYKGGDYIGKVGIEKQYEEKLRGKRGVRYKIVNVQGVVKGEFKDGEYDTTSVPGQSIQLSIDSELQAYAEKLLEGKVGSMVAIDPRTGEILAMVSAPSYNPNHLSGRNLSEYGPSIMNDSLMPLYNRPLQATYAPGSMFKTIQALIAMQENKLSPTEKIICDGSLIGDHAPPGVYDVERAIQLSSNNYFYKVFKRVIEQGDHESRYIDARIGMKKWNDYISKFGLGQRLGVDIPNENKGFIPDIAYYDRVYKGANTWAFSNIYSLSIGQGEVLVTPLQMANLGALLANKGHYYTPHIVKAIDGQGNVEPILNDVGIDEIHFGPVIDGMQKMAESNFRIPIPDIIVCGKTSTVENNKGMDHSGFMGFAPKENPQIAIAAYVENAGWGARAAASIASLCIEKYINGEVKRTWLEDFVYQGDFLDERQKRELEAMNKAKKVAAQ